MSDSYLFSLWIKTISSIIKKLRKQYFLFYGLAWYDIQILAIHNLFIVRVFLCKWQEVKVDDSRLQG